MLQSPSLYFWTCQHVLTSRFRSGRFSHSSRFAKMSTAQFESIYQGLGPASGSEFHALLAPHFVYPCRPSSSATGRDLRESADLKSLAELRIAQSGLGWKSSDEKESVTTVPSSDIKWIQWIR